MKDKECHLCRFHSCKDARSGGKWMISKYTNEHMVKRVRLFAKIDKCPYRKETLKYAENIHKDNQIS